MTHHVAPPPAAEPVPEPQPEPRWRTPRPVLWLEAKLSSPRIIAVCGAIAIVALLISVYVTFAQINLTGCLADYNEASALSSAARSQAAAEDRQVDKRERALDADERVLRAAADAALDAVIEATAAGDRPRMAAAIFAMRTVRRDGAIKRTQIAVARGQLEADRAATEARRAANPLPEAPSKLCG